MGCEYSYSRLAGNFGLWYTERKLRSFNKSGVSENQITWNVLE
jgi:hypothetical protein